LDGRFGAGEVSNRICGGTEKRRIRVLIAMETVRRFVQHAVNIPFY
jgi:hypothetical protein